MYSYREARLARRRWELSCKRQTHCVSPSPSEPQQADPNEEATHEKLSIFLSERGVLLLQAKKVKKRERGSSTESLLLWRAVTFEVVVLGCSWALYASISWCRMFCAAICFSTSYRLGPYLSACN